MIHRTAITIASLSIAAGALAGPLDPPAGAPASTGKTLTELEPRIALNAENTPGDSDSVFKITELGSYYLTDNLRVPQGFAGIEIAQGATVDLNGFNIQRDLNITDGAAIRINTNANAAVRIMNGSVRLLPSGIVNGGIEEGGIADRVSVEHVAFTNISGNAIVLGSASVVRDCRFEAIEYSAIRVGDHSTVERVVAVACGLVVGSAIELGGVSRITDSIIVDAGGDALTVGRQAVISHVQIENPVGAGITATNRVRISDTSVHGGQSDGLRLGQSAFVSNSVLLGNDGFGAVILTGGAGLPSFAKFTDCQFLNNTAGGVVGFSGPDVGLSSTTFRDCYFQQSAAAPTISLHALRACRIERCHFDNGIGVQADASRNTIIDSSFSNADAVLNASNNFFTKNTLGGASFLIDSVGGNFAPAPTALPTNAWDNIDQ